MNSALVRPGAYTKTIAGFNEPRVSGAFIAQRARQVRDPAAIDVKRARKPSVAVSNRNLGQPWPCQPHLELGRLDGGPSLDFVEDPFQPWDRRSFRAARARRSTADSVSSRRRRPGWPSSGRPAGPACAGPLHRAALALHRIHVGLQGQQGVERADAGHAARLGRCRGRAGAVHRRQAETPIRRPPAWPAMRQLAPAPPVLETFMTKRCSDSRARESPRPLTTSC
jgi:hypothetical protein